MVWLKGQELTFYLSPRPRRFSISLSTAEEDSLKCKEHDESLKGKTFVKAMKADEKNRSFTINKSSRIGCKVSQMTLNVQS